MSRKQKIMNFTQCLYIRFRDDEVPALGAQLTYYLILAFFPFLIFLFSIVASVQLSGDEVINELIRMLPEDTGVAIQGIVKEISASKRDTLLSFGMLATIWAASNGINAVIKGLNKAYDEEENRPFWKVRGISLLATFVLACVILLSMLMLIFGKIIGGYISQWMVFPTGLELMWRIVQYVVPVATMMIVFMLLYRIAPNRKLTFKEVIPGSIFTTFGWIVTSVLFSFYVNHYANYSKTYGSLGGVIVLLIWLYMSSILIMLGGEINATLAFSREGKAKQPCKKYGMDIPLLSKKTPPSGPPNKLQI